MPTSNRLILIKIHMLLAAFIFPAALMFLVTGGLYTWEFKGSCESGEFMIPLAAPLSADAAALTEIVKAELDSRGIAHPTGAGKIKKGGLSYQFEWTGSQRDVLLEPIGDPMVAKLTIKETTWYRNLVQLHKAKGGQPFKVYAAVLAVSLFVILLSGFIMAFQIPKYRGQAALFAVAGVVVFFIMLFAS